LACQPVLVLLAAGLLEGLVQGAGVQRELPAAALGGSALVADRTWPAGGAGELHHDGVGAALAGRAPAGAGAALRAGGLLVVPVDGERGGGEPGLGAGLGGVVEQDRGDQGDPEGGLRADEQLGRWVAGVHVVLVGCQATAGQGLVDGVVIFASGTLASVVATSVMRLGAWAGGALPVAGASVAGVPVGWQVSVMWAL